MLEYFSKKTKSSFYLAASFLFSRVANFNIPTISAQSISTGGTGGATGGTGGATGGTGPVELLNPLGPGTTIMSVINNILNYLIYYSVPILALMILWGGFQILGARGSPEKIKTGRTTILYAVIGFTVILASKGVALILLTILGG